MSPGTITSADIKSVIALMERHGIAAFDYEYGTVELHLKLGSDTDTIVQTQQPTESTDPDVVRSPGVGILLFSHPATANPPHTLPREAAKGDVVAYVRTGLTLRAVVANRDCVLLRALAAEGAGVGYDDALFEIAR